MTCGGSVKNSAEMGIYMRLRNIPGSQEAIAESEFVIQAPEQFQGIWREKIFRNENPIHIEIGMGKGRFLSSLALANPDINYIGIEKYASVLLRALEKRNQINCHNLYFLCFDADQINTIFGAGEIDRIYLNFSDPWPKDRHARRRLTSRQFLLKYNQFLSIEGDLAFKTDNRGLFDFSINEAKESGWNLSDVTYNLHESEYNFNNVMTEYEERFSSIGNPIHRLVSRPTDSFNLVH